MWHLHSLYCSQTSTMQNYVVSGQGEVTYSEAMT